MSEQVLWTQNQLAKKRYNVTTRTMQRWRSRDVNPFPAPTFEGAGMLSRWHIKDVEAWERNSEGA